VVVEVVEVVVVVVEVVLLRWEPWWLPPSFTL